MRTRSHLTALALVVASGAVSTVASAQEAPGYAANHLQPSERGSRWFVLDSVEIQGNGRAALGVVGDYSFRPVVHYLPDETIDKSMVKTQVLVHPGASFTFADRVRVGVSVPVQLYAGGHTTTIGGVLHRSAQDAAVGDVRFTGDVRLFGTAEDALRGAVGAQLFIPSGSPSQYTGDGDPRVAPRFSLAGQRSNIAYALKLGAMLRGRDEAWAGGRIGHEVQGALAVGYMTDDKKLLVGPELFGSTVVSKGAAFETKTTPLEVLLGLHYEVADNLRLGAGGGIGLTRAYGAPVARALLGIEWVPGDAKEEAAEEKKAADADGDGISDCDDACSYAAGPKSTDPSKNGCPFVDADQDGIADTEDACRLVAGASSADPKANGCPADADQDGVPDAEDACPQKLGGRTANPKTSGCPDTDGDGVLDPEDACVDQAGIRSANPKANGCPDPDRDHDGVMNDVDACPDDAGKADADPKKNGCPKASLQGGVIRISDQVRFKLGSAEIVGKDSDDVLTAVLGVLKAHPEIQHVRVEGHTDDKGVAAANKKLSQDRAESVVKWLVSKGVDKARLQAEGFGQEKPLTPNTNEEARAQNRRVEFHVEEGSK